MSYRVKSIDLFERQAKRLMKKYPSLRAELLELVDQLEQNPNQGTPIGKNCFKIRLAIKSKGRGKSGGSRVITNLIVDRETVYLLAIYDKSNKESISDKELDTLLQDVPEE